MMIYDCVWLLFDYQEWSCPEAGEVLKKNSVPDWPLLATYLISEASLKESSKWFSYISALPRQPYSLLYWYLNSVALIIIFFSVFEKGSTLKVFLYSSILSFQVTV